MSNLSDLVECPAGKWTRILGGTGSLNVTLSSGLPPSPYRWRVRTSGLPFQRKGDSDAEGIADISIPPSAVFVLKVKPESTTFILAT